MISTALLSQLQSLSVPFVGARWFTATAGRKVTWLVLHSMEAPDKPGTAEAVARYFQRLPPTNKASAHYCVDGDSVVQCVQCKDVAYGAPGANHNGIHIEMAGYAANTEDQWEEPYSLQTIENAAWLAGLVILPKYSIPPVFLSPSDLAAGKSGITTHVNVTKGLPQFHGTHTDPGVNFPVDRFMAFVAEARAHHTA